MAVGAIVFLVTVGAELRIGGGDHAVALEEVGRMGGILEPAGWLEASRSEDRSDAPSVHPRRLVHVVRGAFRRFLQMAGRASALRIPLRSRVVALMAVKAAAHAGELIACRELELLDRTVALAAADVAREVLLMSEDHV